MTSFVKNELHVRVESTKLSWINSDRQTHTQKQR